MNKKPHRIDLLVGKRLRLRRNELGLSQEKLAEKIGVTFQQIQKYEKGSNRISASRLFEIAKATKIPVSYFFGACDSETGPVFSDSKEAILLMRNFQKIPSLEIRNNLSNIVETLMKQKAA